MNETARDTAPARASNNHDGAPPPPELNHHSASDPSKISRNEQAGNRPFLIPSDPRFSSGPCKKHPGWTLTNLETEHLGRSHRAAAPKAHIESAIQRSRQLMQLPDDWVLGIVPGSDTGAFEMAIWSLLGTRGVDALVWESFSSDWAKDLAELGIKPLNVLSAEYGELPDTSAINSEHDLVMVYNGTTSGVCLPNLNFISKDRAALVLCDATSAVFSRKLDYDRLDVVTWSWQKVLGGEAAHGMLALSPRAAKRLSNPAPRALPKLFNLTKNGQLNDSIFSGATINTPGMLALADLHSALDWAENCGGHDGLYQRCADNFGVLDRWVGKTPWVEWLASNPATRSRTSMCLKISSPVFTRLNDEEQKSSLKKMLARLEENSVAFDIANYRSAPTGFRIWGGATVEASDIEALTHWLDWTYQQFETEQTAIRKAGA